MTKPVEVLRLGPVQVPPCGPIDAPIYLVGEAPSTEEEKQLTPFVGQAGRTLRRATAEWIDKARIGNVLPYRTFTYNPQGREVNRTPTVTEIEYFGGLLMDDILEVNPKVIVLLGATATEWAEIRGIIPRSTAPLRDKRARNPYEYRIKHHIIASKPESGTTFECKVLVTYHPQYINYQGQRGDLKTYEEFCADLNRAWSIANETP